MKMLLISISCVFKVMQALIVQTFNAIMKQKPKVRSVIFTIFALIIIAPWFLPKGFNGYSPVNLNSAVIGGGRLNEGSGSKTEIDIAKLEDVNTAKLKATLHYFKPEHQPLIIRAILISKVYYNVPDYVSLAKYEALIEDGRYKYAIREAYNLCKRHGMADDFRLYHY